MFAYSLNRGPKGLHHEHSQCTASSIQIWGVSILYMDSQLSSFWYLNILLLQFIYTLYVTYLIFNKYFNHHYIHQHILIIWIITFWSFHFRLEFLWLNNEILCSLIWLIIWNLVKASLCTGWFNALNLSNISCRSRWWIIMMTSSMVFIFQSNTLYKIWDFLNKGRTSELLIFLTLGVYRVVSLKRKIYFGLYKFRSEFLIIIGHYWVYTELYLKKISKPVAVHYPDHYYFDYSHFVLLR